MGRGYGECGYPSSVRGGIDGIEAADHGFGPGRRRPPGAEEDAMDLDEIARQAEEMVAAGQQADTEAVQKLAKTLNISPELAEYLWRSRSGSGSSKESETPARIDAAVLAPGLGRLLSMLRQGQKVVP